MLIINKMYAGGYLFDDDNIGHEIINLIKANDKKYYIWLNPGGRIDDKRIKENEPIDVLMIRYSSKSIHKVIGLAKNCKIDDSAKMSKNMTQLEIYEKQIGYNIEYNIGKGIRIEDIYNKNKFNGHLDNKTILFTFVCDEILKPKNEMYISTDPNLCDDKFIFNSPYTAREQLRQYVENPENYNFIYDADLWDKYDDSIYYKDNKNEIIESENFYNIIRKEKDEVIMSNSIAYFARKNHNLKKFINYITKQKFDEYFEILREEFNIDIYMYSQRNVVIIENKIDSALNGIIESKSGNDEVFDGQIEKITKDYIEKNLKNNLKISKDYDNNKDCQERVLKIKTFLDSERNKKWSQLSKYYVYAINQLYVEYNGNINEISKHIYSYLLTPNYRRFEFLNVDDNKKILKILNTEYCCSNMYQILYYSDLNKYFDSLKDENLNNNFRFKDFKQMLEIFSRDCDDTLEREMYNKLYRIV